MNSQDGRGGRVKISSNTSEKKIALRLTIRVVNPSYAKTNIPNSEI